MSREDKVINIENIEYLHCDLCISRDVMETLLLRQARSIQQINTRLAVKVQLHGKIILPLHLIPFSIIF